MVCDNDWSFMLTGSDMLSCHTGWMRMRSTQLLIMAVWSKIPTELRIP